MSSERTAADPPRILPEDGTPVLIFSCPQFAVSLARMSNGVEVQIERDPEDGEFLRVSYRHAFFEEQQP